MGKHPRQKLMCGKISGFKTILQQKHPRYTITDFIDDSISKSSSPPLTPGNIEMTNEFEDIDSLCEVNCSNNWSKCKIEIRMLSSAARVEKNKEKVTPERVETLNSAKICTEEDNRIIHLQSLVKLVEENSVCNNCHYHLKLCEDTVGIATSMEISCDICKWNKKTENMRTYLLEC